MANLGKMPNKPFPKLTCVNCGETKSALHFTKRGGLAYEDLLTTDPKRYDTQCKRCNKPRRPGQSRGDVTEPVILSRRKSGKGNLKPKEKLSAAQRKQKTRSHTRIRSMRYLAEKGCGECGERDPRVLEYDHKDPGNKKRIISRLITDGYSWSSRVLRAEIRKCRILCANCHRRHTIVQQGYYQQVGVQEALGKLSAEFEFEL